MTDETELEQIWAYQENAQWKERGWSPEPITYGGAQEYVRVDLYEAERQRAEWWERMEALAASFTDGRGNQFSTRQSRAELRDFMERQGDWALSTEGALCQADDGECME